MLLPTGCTNPFSSWLFYLAEGGSPYLADLQGGQGRGEREDSVGPAPSEMAKESLEDLVPPPTDFGPTQVLLALFMAGALEMNLGVEHNDQSCLETKSVAGGSGGAGCRASWHKQHLSVFLLDPGAARMLGHLASTPTGPPPDWSAVGRQTWAV